MNVDIGGAEKELLPFGNDEVLLKVANILGGEEAVKVVDALKTLKEATDDQISTETGVRLNNVRKILYKLYDYALVTSRRFRDPETGWFIFRWRIQPEMLEGYVQNQKRRILEKLETRLEYEKNNDFYYCFNPKCRRLTFEKAMELIFRCPICEKPLQHFDNSKIIKVLEEKVETLKRELEK